ncbi:hypothetical protein GGF37_004201, partial [Kickxella alabastrina]
MDTVIDQATIDELPFVYQVRIRDIEQEYKDGDITQKGLAKRVAQLMQEYQSSTDNVRNSILAAGYDEDVLPGARKMQFDSPGNGSSGSSTVDSGVNPKPGAHRSRGAADAVVGVRSGSTKANYDARKSTAMGFKKPGINFEALLDDFSSSNNNNGGGMDDYGDDMHLSHQQQRQKLSVETGYSREESGPLSPQFGFSLGSPMHSMPPMPTVARRQQNAGYGGENSGDFDEMTSGRAYDVLSDMMDPYTALSSQNNQELYSDNSSSNSILDEISDLEPTGYMADMVGAQSTTQHPHELTGQDRLAEVAVGSALAHAQRDFRPEPIQIAADRGNVQLPSRLGAPSMPSASQLLTPDTPTVGLFIHHGIDPQAAARAAPMQEKRPVPVPHMPFSAAAAETFLSPVSGTHETHEFDAEEEEMYASLRQEKQQQRPHSARSSVLADTGAASTIRGGTITLKDMVLADTGFGSDKGSAAVAAAVAAAAATFPEPPVSPGRVTSHLQQLKRNSIQSAAFGGGLQVVNSNDKLREVAFPVLDEVDTVEQAQQMQKSVAARAVSRRPTYGTRSAGWNAVAAKNAARISYYEAEHESELEVPANFDMMMLAAEQMQIAGPVESEGGRQQMGANNRQSLQYTFEESAAMSMDAQTYLEMTAPAEQVPMLAEEDPDMATRGHTSYLYEGPLVYEDWDASMQAGGENGAAEHQMVAAPEGGYMETIVE